MPASLPVPGRILLIQLRHFGDVVLAMPLARDLRRVFPDARIDFMVGARAAPMLENDPHIDNVLVFDKSKAREMLRQVRARRYDWVIDSQVNPRTSIMTLLSGAPVRVGWDARFWGMVYNYRTIRDGEPMYVVRNRQRLLELVGVQPGSSLPFLYLTDTERTSGRTALDALNIDGESPVAGIVLETREAERNWRMDGFAEVAEALQREGTVPLIFRFPGDENVVESFRNLTSSGTFVPWVGDRHFLGVLSQCDVLLSPDTGPSHMATAIGVPRVSLHGPSLPVFWSPPGVDYAVPLTNPRVVCQGCRFRECPLDRECLLGITADEVLSAVRRMIKMSRREPTRKRATPG